MEVEADWAICDSRWWQQLLAIWTAPLTGEWQVNRCNSKYIISARNSESEEKETESRFRFGVFFAKWQKFGQCDDLQKKPDAVRTLVWVCVQAVQKRRKAKHESVSDATSSQKLRSWKNKQAIQLTQRQKAASALRNTSSAQNAVTKGVWQHAPEKCAHRSEIRRKCQSKTAEQSRVIDSCASSETNEGCNFPQYPWLCMRLVCLTHWRIAFGWTRTDLSWSEVSKRLAERKQKRIAAVSIASRHACTCALACGDLFSEVPTLSDYCTAMLVSHARALRRKKRKKNLHLPLAGIEPGRCALKACVGVAWPNAPVRFRSA